ncbi:retropepsin-like aspartic protease family protein [Rhizobium paknamense]|uniref:Aspartyl protease family protein n=1 Tax=Rhizobium paknamense TaxID=1206817 RepID=A0ABU0IDA9_9HYPH|nr:TIGR02281 family clan AA aspartic protease [Rhizobium paknamense]MDQ0455420.1 aspartyl protease family protein [Rhizobium paknamense]
MLMRVAIFASVAVAAATQVPRLMEALSETGVPSAPVPVVSTAAPTPATLSALPYGQAVLMPDARGHYGASFRLNGKPVEALVDTGASYVTLNESTARRLGFSGSNLTFAYKVNTANGETAAAQVTLDRVEIGNLRVSDVPALVLRDKALSDTLIGMSFLTKLGSYRVDNGRLTLSQR